jgi:hypothetical protein
MRILLSSIVPLCFITACQLDGTGATADPPEADDAVAVSNAAMLANPEGSGPFCRITLAKLEPGETQSRVLSYTCAASAGELENASIVPAASVLLMTWYQDIGFGGPSTQLFGSAGPCDAEGYGFANVGAAWNDRISSFKAFNNCNRAVAFTNINFGGTSATYVNAGGVGHTPALSVSFVGTAMNDKISSFLINRQ